MRRRGRGRGRIRMVMRRGSKVKMTLHNAYNSSIGHPASGLGGSLVQLPRASTLSFRGEDGRLFGSFSLSSSVSSSIHATEDIVFLLVLIA